MAYQLTNAIHLGDSNTGLTLAAQLIDTAGANTGSEVTSGFTEIGSGWYQWNYASIPDGFRGVVKFYPDGFPSSVSYVLAINPEEGEYTDVASSTLATAASVTALNDLSAADVNAEVDTALADYDAPTKAELDAGFAALNDLSTAQVNAEVDTALADYDAPTKAELDTAQSAIQTDIAALNDISTAQVNAEVDTALADYDAPTKAELDTGLAALNDLTAAEIWTYGDRTTTNSVQAIEPIDANGNIIMTKAVTYTATIAGLSIPANWSVMYLTVKYRENDAETLAIIQVKKTNGGDPSDGLIRLNASTIVTGTASLSVDQSAGSIVYTVSDNTLALVEPMRGVYDVKSLNSDGSSWAARGRKLVVQATATHTI